MSEIRLQITEIPAAAKSLRAGERVLLSGTVYTARDAAHGRIFAALDRGEPLPFPIQGSVIYYAGPTPRKPDGQIGSFGPTTSARMDVFTPRLLELGLAGVIGKGDRSPAVMEAFRRTGAVYFCAGGGFGALISRCIAEMEEIAYPELGCESVKRLLIRDLPVIVGADAFGNSAFAAVKKQTENA